MTRQQIIDTIQELPADTLPEVAQFIEFIRYKVQANEATPYKPVALGGLWAGIVFTEADITEARDEMWGNLGERVKL